MASKTPMLSVVIPAYNRLDPLLQLLADLDAQKAINFETIVIDDHSALDPTGVIRRHFPSVSVLRNRTNSGPAVSRNRGIKAARGQIVVGFDSDVSLRDATLLRRVADYFHEKRTVDAVAFRLLRPDGITDDSERWFHPVPLAEHADKTFITSYFSGTGYAMRREAALEAGLFPEILFMHYEEVELAYRLIDNARTLVYSPEFSVVHHAHPVSRRSEIRTFYKPRNQVLLAVGCMPWGRATRYLAPRLLYQFLLAIRDRHLGGFARALASVAQKLPERLQQRRVLRRSTFLHMSGLRDGRTPDAPELHQAAVH